MLGFELKVVEAHGRRRRRKAKRHLTLFLDAVTSYRKNASLPRLNRIKKIMHSLIGVRLHSMIKIQHKCCKGEYCFENDMF
ncbi:hypothetical protein EEL49_09410 [Muribaculaceae bacterium Isolate-104 (HZI)]|nr:hypothetical protein EEL49_09410 [Muribaculaceae bacterium Isolate-104 (HZI)]